ncbi:uncharacterized protein LOC128355351 [Scomber japonicus]|uniref:uncharacterized protein LOC128355351 n=1 Tax=Scomber japonicus TaxID=13676 RepID=UPI0023056C9B|nr:uncharacterized protein LOC128355351 [Scomber japonicus]
MKKMKGALLIVPIALVVLGLGFMYNDGDTAMITTKRSPKNPTVQTPTVTPDSAEEQWTTGSPRSNLNGKMVTLSHNGGGGVAFYPTYYVNTSDYQTTPPPTRSYPYRLYPYGSYSDRPYYYSNYRNRFYPTQAYRNRFYPTQAYRNRFYPTQPYRNRFYFNEPYRNRFYPAQTYPDKFYPTQAYAKPATTPTTPYPTTRYTRPYTTTRYPYWTTQYPNWTTAPTTAGVSVCVRYLTDFDERGNPTLFTLSPSSRTALRLTATSNGWYTLAWDRFSYYKLSLRSNNRFWSNIGPELWTRVCLTVDTIKNVAQVFSGSTMSIRKMLPIKYVWSGEPVIEFAGFDGQVTDVQMWDYPLAYNEIFNYMSGGVYSSYSGSVLTWSNIGYNLRGNTLLEQRYEMKENEMKEDEKSSEKSSKKEKKSRVTWEKMYRKLLKEIGRRERKKFSQL